jgi:hypothetical protein
MASRSRMPIAEMRRLRHRWPHRPITWSSRSMRRPACHTSCGFGCEPPATVIRTTRCGSSSAAPSRPPGPRRIGSGRRRRWVSCSRKDPGRENPAGGGTTTATAHWACLSTSRRADRRRSAFSRGKTESASTRSCFRRDGISPLHLGCSFRIERSCRSSRPMRTARRCITPILERRRIRLR